MSRYIDAEALDNRIKAEWAKQEDDKGYGLAHFFVESQPTADVAPVIHAHWKLKAKLWWGTIYECSHCGRFVTLDEGTSRILLRTDYPHCHCGAKMDEEVKQ